MMNSNEAHTTLKTMPVAPPPRGNSPRTKPVSNRERFERFLNARGVRVQSQSKAEANEIRWLD